MGNEQTDKAFGKFPSGKSVFQTILDVIFGGGFCVSNYFAIDPNTGQIYVAATADDAQDGKIDGKSDDGALYRLELTPGVEDSALWSLAIKKHAVFPGGTGSTPTVDTNSQRVLISDDNHNVLALDPMELSTLWSVSVGAQVAASIAVAPEGDVYCVTATSVSPSS
jgi:DNA-binding beta-propeller fold protein YncE